MSVLRRSWIWISLGILSAGFFALAVWVSAGTAGLSGGSPLQTPELHTALTDASSKQQLNLASTSGDCLPWEQVNDSAFGMDTGSDESYDHEEAFEVLVYKDRLYLGMEADNGYGARIWRTSSGVQTPDAQSDWEEVAADENGLPFGHAILEQVDHIDSLAAYKGYIYASTANQSGTELGTLIYRSPDGDQGTWSEVIQAGFGIPGNTNFKDMLVFTPTIPLESGSKASYLCGGAGNETEGGRVYCSPDGLNWNATSEPGFGDVGNYLIASISAHSGALYAGVVNPQGGSVWRSSDLATWEQVFASPSPRVEVLVSLDGNLYIATGAEDGRLPGIETEVIKLYSSSSGDPSSWQALPTPLSADIHNSRTIVDGNLVYNRALYLSTMNPDSGAEIWRTENGTSWTQVNQDGFGLASTFAAELVGFNGYLYAWTSDYGVGQRVYRTGCPVSETVYLEGAGVYSLPAVSSTFTLTSGSVISLVLSVYPGAYPLEAGDAWMIPRWFELEPYPEGVEFLGSLEVNCDPAELVDSLTGPPEEVFPALSRFTPAGWIACEPTRIDLDCQVTCASVQTAGIWGLSWQPANPAAAQRYLPLLVRNRTP